MIVKNLGLFFWNCFNRWTIWPSEVPSNLSHSVVLLLCLKIIAQVGNGFRLLFLCCWFLINSKQLTRKKSGEGRKDKRRNTEGRDNAATGSLIPLIFLRFCDKFVWTEQIYSLDWNNDWSYSFPLSSSLFFRLLHNFSTGGVNFESSA